MSGFRLHGLDPATFAPLFHYDDAELAGLGARRVTATSEGGFPCRVSLADADIGAEVLLLPFEHQPAPSPFRAMGPIYVCRNARQPALAPGELPGYICRRLISIRAYDSGHCIVAACVTPGEAVAEELERLLADTPVAYLHLHSAARGCYLGRVDRV